MTGDADSDPEGMVDLRVREPTLLDALIPTVTLISLIALTIALFGAAATDGPLQVALLTSAAVAALVAFKNGHDVARVRDSAIGGISSAMGAIFILLAVGGLIGTWNMAGTIPTVVYYGVGLLSETWFYAATALVCGLVGLATGSSWTTAGTLGVAFVAIAPLIGASPAIAAGAVISGAYFGDKMTPLSETTVLVPSLVGGVTTAEHIGAMLWTSGPAFLISLVLFVVIGLTTPASGTSFDPAAAQAVLAGFYQISLLNLLPLVLLVVLSVRQVPPFLAIFGCAVFAGVLALFTQPALVESFVGDPAQGYLVTGIEAIYAALATGFVSTTGNETIDALFSRGGMASMLTTIWLVLGALELRGDHGKRRLPRAAHPTRPRSREVDRKPHRIGHLHGHRTQHRRGRPVRRGRPAEQDLSDRVCAAWHSAPDALPRRRGLRDGHLAADPLEYMRRLHGRRARRRHRRVPAVRILLPHQSGHLSRLRLHRGEDRIHQASRQGARTGNERPNGEGPVDGRRHSMTAASSAGGPASPWIRPAVRLHDPVHPHRRGGAADLDHPGRPVRRRSRR